MAHRPKLISKYRDVLGTLTRIWQNVSKNNQPDALRRRVEECIAKGDLPDTAESENAYLHLVNSYSGPGEYGYGERPNWLRGVDRAKQLIGAIPSLAPGSRALEVGCGDGMAAVVLQSFGIHVQLTDLRDWRDKRASMLPFSAIDLSNAAVPLPDGPFDLIYSYNAFEHFPAPDSVVARMLTQLRPGGYLFFEFGPLYSGPWGLHAYRMLPMPYPQFLFSEPFWKSKIKQIGIRDLGQNLDDLQPLNRWTVRQFDDLWASSGCVILRNERYVNDSFINLVTRYPRAFQGRGLTYEDLTTQALCVLLQKPA